MIGIGVYFANLSKSGKRPQIDNVEYITYEINTGGNVKYSVNLIYTGEIAKNKLIEICNEFNKKYDDVEVYIFSSKEGYLAYKNSAEYFLKNKTFSEPHRSDLLLYYLKHYIQSKELFVNEITWLQRKGVLENSFELQHKFNE